MEKLERLIKDEYFNSKNRHNYYNDKMIEVEKSKGDINRITNQLMSLSNKKYNNITLYMSKQYHIKVNNLGVIFIYSKNISKFRNRFMIDDFKIPKNIENKCKKYYNAIHNIKACK